MFFIPLSQPESVELVVHALRVAGGQADCTSCPVRKVCMKQCLTIADAVSRMLEAGTLPSFEPGRLNQGDVSRPEPEPPAPGGAQKARLKVVK